MEVVGFIAILIAVFGVIALPCALICWAGSKAFAEPPPPNIFRDRMVCMDCGSLTGTMLWIRGKNGALRYDEDCEHTCHVCGWRMTCKRGEVAPEY